MRACLWIFAAVCMAACAGPEKRVKSFPAPEELGVRKGEMGNYLAAKGDFDLLLAGKEPTTARCAGVIYDGGSRFYKGPGYRLTQWEKVAMRSGVNGRVEGPEITFCAPLSRVGCVVYGETKFVPIGRTRGG